MDLLQTWDDDIERLPAGHTINTIICIVKLVTDSCGSLNRTIWSHVHRTRVILSERRLCIHVPRMQVPQLGRVVGKDESGLAKMFRQQRFGTTRPFVSDSVLPYAAQEEIFSRRMQLEVCRVRNCKTE
ncbi:hypothetical protein AVEN_186164-1 [Araneus ventricosus]|uniref:Uncharacterized protein n=1 Tax=Araneus ventricosus TaxID=182803 RepID=A0A4Y2GE45_ARAVE|nr:hypothetical protein AVEN_186164-1 [Araneus ventricosus]